MSDTPWDDIFEALGDLQDELDPKERDMPPSKKKTSCDCKTASPSLDKLREAESKRTMAEARKWLAEAKISEIELGIAVEQRDAQLAQNSRHKVYVFDSSVEAGSVKKCINQLTQWHRQDPGCAIEITINSPGGSIFDGFVLVDFIRDLREKGHQVTMVVYGMAASMGGVLLQAADHRVMGANAFLLIHEGSLGIGMADFGNAEDHFELMKMFHTRILNLFEERAKPINPKTTAKFIKRNWMRKDWWIPSEDALKLGLVDEVR
jgi:ATP-dependent protease ClpP protease subunit